MDKSLFGLNTSMYVLIVFLSGLLSLIVFSKSCGEPE